MSKILKHSPIEQPLDEVLYTSPHGWITVKKNGEFYYCERKGQDSIAFVLFATNLEDHKRIGVVREYKSPIGIPLITAFGGSIDDEKYHENLYTLVIDEVLEESGFRVSEKDIVYYGKVYVSTQMNQYCHLFAVSVDKFVQGLRTTENPLELQSVIEWLTLPEVFKLEDWKAILITAKRMAEEKGMIRIIPINEVQNSSSQTINEQEETA